jgi:TM2 domain-containing membrane protein YozV
MISETAIAIMSICGIIIGVTILIIGTRGILNGLKDRNYEDHDDWYIDEYPPIEPDNKGKYNG